MRSMSEGAGKELPDVLVSAQRDDEQVDRLLRVVGQAEDVDQAQEDDVSMLTMLGRAASGGAAIYIALLVAGCLFALLSILFD